MEVKGSQFSGWGKALLCFGATMVAMILVSAIFIPVDTESFWIQSVVRFVLALAFLLVFVVFRKSLPRKDVILKVQPSNAIITILTSLVCIAAFMLLQFAAIDLFVAMGYSPSLETFTIDSWGMYLMCVLVIAVFPAVLEELIFRGVIFNELKKHGTILAIVASSAMFAAFHLTLVQFVYQFILGVVFALVYLRTGNIMHAILLHFVNNFFIITYTFIAGNDYMSYTWNALTIVTAILLAIIGTFAIIGLVKSLKKENHARNK